VNPRQVILSRRARFVAAALATLGSAGCGKEKAQPADAGAPAVDASAGADAAKPHPCLCLCQPGDPLCSCL
jgi:hypothetical protein